MHAAYICLHGIRENNTYDYGRVRRHWGMLGILLELQAHDDWRICKRIVPKENISSHIQDNTPIVDMDKTNVAYVLFI